MAGFYRHICAQEKRFRLWFCEVVEKVNGLSLRETMWSLIHLGKNKLEAGKYFWPF